MRMSQDCARFFGHLVDHRSVSRDLPSYSGSFIRAGNKISLKRLRAEIGFEGGFERGRASIREAPFVTPFVGLKGLLPSPKEMNAWRHRSRNQRRTEAHEEEYVDRFVDVPVDTAWCGTNRHSLPDRVVMIVQSQTTENLTDESDSAECAFAGKMGELRLTEQSARRTLAFQQPRMNKCWTSIADARHHGLYGPVRCGPEEQLCGLKIKRGVLTLRYPVEHGAATDWDDTTKESIFRLSKSMVWKSTRILVLQQL